MFVCVQCGVCLCALCVYMYIYGYFVMFFHLTRFKCHQETIMLLSFFVLNVLPCSNETFPIASLNRTKVLQFNKIIMNCNYLVLLVVLLVVKLLMTQINGRLVVPLASIPSERTYSGAVRESL